METKRVSILRCEKYEYAFVQKAVYEAFNTIGVTRDMLSGKRVFIKANLVLKCPPERCATTHPTVIAAIAQYVMDMGGQAAIGDSPGGPLQNTRMDSIYDVAGMTEAAERTGAELNYNLQGTEIFCPEAKVLKRFTLMEEILKADVVITAGKLKTHGMTAYTGAVKNLYGCIPGMTKVEYHYRMPELTSFSNMLVDLCEYIKPQISIIDAIFGMERDGPTAGDPKQLNAIIASLNPHAADVAALKLINVEPRDICTVSRAIERGLIREDYSDVEIVGDIESLICRDFIIHMASPERLKLLNRYIPSFLHKPLEKWMTPKPRIMKRVCKSCGVCAKACPPKAIDLSSGLPVIDTAKCIHCFCCHEMCPHRAIRIKRPFIAKIK